MDTHVFLSAVWWCAKPSTVMPVAFVIGVGLLVFRRRLAAAVLLSLSMVVLIIATVLPTSRLLAQALEGRVGHVEHLPPTVDGIIVLGGNGADRLPPFAELAGRYPSARLVFSGGGETQSAHQALSHYGDLANRTIYEGLSRNTYENALFSKQLLEPDMDETWVLVTNALHMSRAVRAFAAVGWEVIAYPVAFTEKPPPTWSFFERLSAFDEVSRELLASTIFSVPLAPPGFLDSGAGGAAWTQRR